MKKIIIPYNLWLTNEQKNILKQLWNTVFFDDKIKDENERLKRIEWFDIVFTEEFWFTKNLYNIKNKFITFPFISIWEIDKQKLKKSNIVIANCPWINKLSVSEWIISMTLNLTRRFSHFANNKTLPKTNDLPEIMIWLEHKNILILWKWNIWKNCWKIFENFWAKVSYFIRWNELLKKSKDIDIVINTLPINKKTEWLLWKDFFFWLKKGCFYITSSRSEIHNIDVILKSINKWIILWFADDCASEKPWNIHNKYYQKLLNYKNTIITPHIAWATDNSFYNWNQMWIKNIESRLKWKPQNIIT